jgi:hypothetical protein
LVFGLLLWVSVLWHLTYFFVLLITLCYVANAQKAFDQVRALLTNLKAGNVKDQELANTRQAAEQAWCKAEIAKAAALLAKRQHDVDSLKKHITYLVETRNEARKDRATRIERIKKNLALLKKFKKQRCDNNLLFVKQLREHMQGVEVLKLLRGDIVAYFAAKPEGQRGAFVERFEQYTNLLDEEHKQIFTELKSEITNMKAHKLDRDQETSIVTRTDASVNAQGARLTAQKERTVKQIGKGHVDNNKAALKRLKTPEYQKIAAFNKATRTKVLGMIDGLIKHLRASRRKLTSDEIHAAEDFAIFQNAMIKENKYLEAKIKELTAEIIDLTAQIKVSRVQLIKRKQLRNKAKEALALLRKMCQEKRAYFTRETKRRNKENVVMDQSLALFNKIINGLSARVRARASSITESGKLSGKNAMDTRVVSSKAGVKSGVAGRVNKREAVVF